MKMKNVLREYVSLLLNEQHVSEGKIGASKEYLDKERIREKLQQFINEQIVDGYIYDQTTLNEFISDVNSSMLALKMIPFTVWSKILNTK